jgi:hypothetical protein
MRPAALSKTSLCGSQAQAALACKKGDNTSNPAVSDRMTTEHAFAYLLSISLFISRSQSLGLNWIRVIEDIKRLARSLRTCFDAFGSQIVACANVLSPPTILRGGADLQQSA